MATPKKKLPTGPIRIETTIPKKIDIIEETGRQESIKPESGSALSTKPDSSKQESGFVEASLQEEKHSEVAGVSPESGQLNLPVEERLYNENTSVAQVEEPAIIPPTQREAINPSDLRGAVANSTVNSIFPAKLDLELIDSGKQDSDLEEIECKKVAMRLSAEAVTKLQTFRHETGIPYEILVDVIVRNWDSLPQRTQSNYLQQAKQLRASRLIAGQEKTMRTMRAKYSS